jgi:toxin-antitoxin system PIN domain toxin
VIAVDTNILVYAHREETPEHVRALGALRTLDEAGHSWGVPWACIHEFFAVVTHARVYDRPSTVQEALTAIDDLLGMGALLLSESSRHRAVLGRLCQQSDVVGPRVHDARIASICIGHGVSELWTADRDFSRFPELKTRNPLVAAHR